MNRFVVPAAIIAIIAAVGVVAYTVGTNQSGKQAATTSVPTPTSNPISETPSPTFEPTTTSKSTASKSQMAENIQAAVQSKNYAALEGYMANDVSVILYATECCGILSPQKATEQMAYLNNGTPPWDFSPSNPIAQKLINTDASNFSGRIIGIASNGMVVSFNLNNENKIDKIFISADYKLIAP
ncbi:MAG: hypothetical protein HY427_01400 [Candidatus Levybacteria bacterium]|nr:hypothetical protein [Candidatus Levybacteria bacterium]